MTEEAQQGLMAQVEPHDEHRWLQRLVGDWTYEMTANMGPEMPQETMHGEVTVRPLGKLWVLIEERADPERKGPRSNIITLGYNPEKPRFVGTFIDSGSAHLWIYDGRLSGNKLSLDSEGPAMTGTGMAMYRDVVEIIDDNHWVLRGQAPAEDGQWFEFMTSHYRRK